MQQYEGSNQRGSMVKSLIQQARSIVLSNNSYYGDELKVNIVYTSETGQKTNFNVLFSTFSICRFNRR